LHHLDHVPCIELSCVASYGLGGGVLRDDPREAQSALRTLPTGNAMHCMHRARLDKDHTLS